jgi:hypothetical protein
LTTFSIERSFSVPADVHEHWIAIATPSSLRARAEDPDEPLMPFF